MWASNATASSRRRGGPLTARTPSRLVLTNGRIYTQDAARPTAEALASIGNRIVAVGSDAEALAAAGPGAERIDLAVGPCVPGFVDAHFHFLGYSFDRQRARLDRATSVAEVQRLVAVAAEKVGPDAWVLGRGWDRNLWPGAAVPEPPRPRRGRRRPAGLPAQPRRPRRLGEQPRAGAGRDHAPTRPIRPAARSCASPTAPRAASCWSRPASACGRCLTARRPRLAVAAARAAQDALIRVGVTGPLQLRGRRGGARAPDARSGRRASAAGRGRRHPRRPGAGGRGRPLDRLRRRPAPRSACSSCSRTARSGPGRRRCSSRTTTAARTTGASRPSRSTT